jgi:hypothetical protein
VTDAGTLLHNMSAPPRTVLRHAAASRRPGCRGLVFQMRPDITDTSPAALLRLLGEEAGDDAGHRLRQRIEEHVRTLALPAAAAVARQPLPGDSRCTDLLTVLAVLAKSSGHVYLRDKEPNLAALRPDRRVVLLVPTAPGG